MKNKLYYDVVKAFKKKLTIDYPVYVRRVPMPKSEFGDCSFDDDNQKFVIRIDRKLPQYWAVETFLHEIAHVLSWDEEEDHGRKWGVAYSKVYRMLLKHWEIEDKEDKVAKSKLQ